MKRLFAIFILTLSLVSHLNAAQKVGVVMSGGGAKGLYHVGVLQALEESGIPIDYVAGTSMGAITAGLYAAGYSPNEMRDIALSGELEKWVNGRIDTNYGSYFRQGSTLRSDAPTLSFRLDPSKTANQGESAGARASKMPRSLIPTTQIDLALCNIFTPASTIAKDDFNKLMVPFLCVASDVTAHDKMVITNGDLGLAIRASMAFPLAFTPVVREDGHMLYDGGIQDNFPWQSMVEHFDPDVIVGAVCGADEWTDASDLSVIDQAFMLAMNRTNYDLPENGIMVRRNVPVGTLDFSNTEAVMQMGYDDTMAQIDSIIMQVGRENLLPKEYYDNRRKAFNIKKPVMQFSSYEITGLSPEKRDYAEGYMLTQNRRRAKEYDQQRRMDFKELQNTLFSILSSGDFTTSYPKTHYDPLSASYDFKIGMEHKPSLKLSLGGNLSSTPFNQIYLGLNYTNINNSAKSLFTELYLGPVYTTGRMGYRSDFYLKAPMFIDAYYNFSMMNLGHGDFGFLTPIDNTLDMINADQFFSVGVGSPLKKRSQILLRTNIGTERVKYLDGVSTIPEINAAGWRFDMTRLNYAAAKLEIERSTIDNIYYPSRGSFLSASAIGVLGFEKSFASKGENANIEHTFTTRHTWLGAKFNYTNYFGVTRDNTVSMGLKIDGIYTTIPDMHSESGEQIIMPRYTPTIHSNMVYMPEYSATRYLALGLMTSVKVWREFSLRAGFYSMLRDNYDPKSLSYNQDKGVGMKYISEFAFAYNTSIGPLSLSLSKYDVKSRNNLYLTFNFGYPIFSPRGVFY